MIDLEQARLELAGKRVTGMNILLEFMKNRDGVHLMTPCNSEYSLCGDAWDIGSTDGADNMKSTKETTVTCKECLRVLRICQKYLSR